LNLDSSIVANNSSAVGADILGSVSSGDYNLIETTFGIHGALPGTHNKTGIDPMLGPLAFNGGPTQTHALTCGSPAIDAGNTTEALLTDQRGHGFPRTFDDPGVPNEPSGDGTDIGAFEQVCAQTPFFTDCPANIAAANDPGQCSATVSFTVSAAGIRLPPLNAGSGLRHHFASHLPSYATAVVCTRRTLQGFATCQFNVAVSDNQPPSVACLADQSVSTCLDCAARLSTTPRHWPPTIVPGRAFPAHPHRARCSRSELQRSPAPPPMHRTTRLPARSR
jgi:hypothetical protein